MARPRISVTQQIEDSFCDLDNEAQAGLLSELGKLHRWCKRIRKPANTPTELEKQLSESIEAVSLKRCIASIVALKPIFYEAGYADEFVKVLARAGYVNATDISILGRGEKVLADLLEYGLKDDLPL